ncbi:MAG TPA: SGNH/GDSL hydrolase family protein [Candidatus Sulfotelmatobacter sp.]|nr:SGNH/GDSL hydrolase family protein [Candidatus Sulfotelmatobacter sp.]
MSTNRFSIAQILLNRRFVAFLLLQLLTATALLAGDSRESSGSSNEHWVATWSTALHQPDLAPGLANTGFVNQTLRQVVHACVGGRQVRVRLSTFGASGLVVGSAHIALSAGGSAVIPASDRVLTFGGKPSVEIPPGAPLVSDPVELVVPALSDLAITLFLPGVTGPATWHFDARQTSYVSPSGDFTASAVMPLDPLAPTVPSWFWLSAVDVLSAGQSGAIAAFGESTTDGAESTVDANHRWSDWLARNIVTQPGRPAMGVLNEGLDGNRLLHDGLGPNGLARFERDVLSQSGLTHVIVYFGINDIGTGWPGGLNPDQEVTVDQIIDAYRQLIQRSHTRGIRIYGGTITPFNGFFIPGTPFPVWSPGNEMKRQQLNQWIRLSREFDGVIDFDRALRDPNAPSQLLAQYDSGDHAHPNDAGYKAMAEAIDSRLFGFGK